MARYRPTFEQVSVHNHPNVVRHVAPLYYEGDGGVVIKGRTYEFLVSSALGRHIPYDPRKLPVVVVEPDPLLSRSIARIYRDGYSGGTTLPRPSLA